MDIKRWDRFVEDVTQGLEKSGLLDPSMMEGDDCWYLASEEEAAIDRGDTDDAELWRPCCRWGINVWVWDGPNGAFAEYLPTD